MAHSMDNIHEHMRECTWIWHQEYCYVISNYYIVKTVSSDRLMIFVLLHISISDKVMMVDTGVIFVTLRVRCISHFMLRNFTMGH